MRLILPGLAVLLLTACGLKDDLYLPDDSKSEPSPAIATEITSPNDGEPEDDDAENA